MRRLITAAGAVAAVAGCVTGLLFLGPDTSRPSATASPAGAADRDTGSVETIRKRTAAYPDDPAAWADLAHTEIERARTTFDAGLLDAADKALHRSLALDGTDNYRAVTGRGLLANARHDFGEGRVHGLRATRMAPDRPDGYAVLADAEIQLGNYPQAREAVQRMLDIAPATAAYSRAAYDLETGGRPEDAAVALQRAVDSAVTQDERAFAEARLGDLAWSQGRTDRAARHYGRALSAVPAHPYGQAGLARVAAARGHTGKALELYARLVERMPLPQFLLESLDLRRASGIPTGGASGQSCRRRCAWPVLTADLSTRTSSSTRPTTATRRSRWSSRAGSGNTSAASSSPMPWPGPCTVRDATPKPSPTRAGPPPPAGRTLCSATTAARSSSPSACPKGPAG